MNTISTHDLITHIKRKAYEPSEEDSDCVEASLILNGNIRATHFMYYDDPYIYDEGIDGKTRRILPLKFVAEYHNARWLVKEQ